MVAIVHMVYTVPTVEMYTTRLTEGVRDAAPSAASVPCTAGTMYSSGSTAETVTGEQGCTIAGTPSAARSSASSYTK